MPGPANPIVHLELHTGNLPRALAFYTRLFEWRPQRYRSPCGAYTSIETGGDVEGGVVEREADGALWLPYVEVGDIIEATDRARLLGAHISVDPREGPAGWRSVLGDPAGGEIALWQRKN